MRSSSNSCTWTNSVSSGSSYSLSGLTPLQLLVTVTALLLVYPPTPNPILVNAAPSSPSPSPSVASSSSSQSTYAHQAARQSHPHHHIELERNHAAQSLRKRDPDALLSWADEQVARLKAKQRQRRQLKRSKKRDAVGSHLGLGRDERISKTKRGDQVDSESGSRLKRRQKGYEELHNLYSDTEYYAKVSIGTPPQDFNVILDTGSADLWLAGAGCSSSSGCETSTRLYRTTNSSTSEHSGTGGSGPGSNRAIVRNSTSPTNTSTTATIGDRFRISYGSGEAAGVLVQDVVSLAGYSVPNQTFASCSDVTRGLLTGPVSGIMGLGFQSISMSNALPWWQTLAQSSELGENSEMGFAFTRFLHDPASSSQVMPGGVASFGQANRTLYSGNITWSPLQEDGYWLIQLQDIHVGNTSLGIKSNSVAMDTGTSLIGAPTRAVEAIFAQIEGSRPADDPARNGYYYFPCDSSVSVSFTFGNKQWFIDPSDFNLGRVHADNMCLGAFFSLEGAEGDPDTASPEDVENPTGDEEDDSTGGPSWIVGDTFLKNVYSVFRYDNPRAVGFAELSDIAKGLGDTKASVTGFSIAGSATSISTLPSIGFVGGLMPLVMLLMALYSTLVS